MKNWSRDPRRYLCMRSSGTFALSLCLGLLLVSPQSLTTQSTNTQTSVQQPQSPAASTPAQEPSQEMSIKEETTTPSATDTTSFRVNVKLVLARVVVRDSNGHAIGNLRKEDFELLDNGKPQVISNFDVEHGAAPPSPAPRPVTTVSNPADSSQPAATLPRPEFPSRYVAYLFDDVHLSFQDLAAARNAAHHAIDALAASDRAALFSTSGQTEVDFTDDRAKLHQTLNKLAPRPISAGEVNACPDISFYQADLIANKNNPEATQTAIIDYMNCGNLPASAVGRAAAFVQSRALEISTAGEHESRITLGVIHDVIRRMMTMPGQRNLVFVSPGFLTPDLQYEFYDIVDRALRAQVVINSLDARGLYALIPGGDASQEGHSDIAQGNGHAAFGNGAGATAGDAGSTNTHVGTGGTPTPHSVLDLQAASAQDSVLSVLAYDTGGTLFHNNNDLDEGFRRLGMTPEYYYIFGFTPQNLKNDGKFHTLKVTLKSRPKYDLQARRGYYAPRQAANPAEAAQREIEDEMHSNEELHDLPVTLRTQFFKGSVDSAKITVMARVDVRRLHYKQADDRNQNDLTIVTEVFDPNGNILQSNQKVVQMRWKNETLQSKLASGITVRTSFDVKPGRYMVRIVARDTEQQLMSAENDAIEIP